MSPESFNADFYNKEINDLENEITVYRSKIDILYLERSLLCNDFPFTKECIKKQEELDQDWTVLTEMEKNLALMKEEKNNHLEIKKITNELDEIDIGI